MRELTKREKEIANLVTWGASVKEVAAILCISDDTVRVHLKHIKRKLGVNKTTEIVAFMFCTEYHIPLSNDRIGNIRRIVSALICLFLFGLVEFEQLDFIRAVTRTTSTRTTGRRCRKGKENDLIFDYATALE